MELECEFFKNYNYSIEAYLEMWQSMGHNITVIKYLGMVKQLFPMTDTCRWNTGLKVLVVTTFS